METLNELMSARREKLAAFREAGINPYPYRYEAPPGVSQGIAAANGPVVPGMASGDLTTRRRHVRAGPKKDRHRSADTVPWPAMNRLSPGQRRAGRGAKLSGDRPMIRPILGMGVARELHP